MTKDKRTEAEKEEARQRRLANLKTFKPYDQLTEEEKKWQKEIVTKGGKARGEQVKKCKSMKEQALTILETKLSREQAETLIGESASLLEDSDLTMQSVLLLSAVKEVTENGNAKMLEILRDTSGQKPKDSLEISADIMTDADRSLMEKVGNRLKLG